MVRRARITENLNGRFMRKGIVSKSAQPSRLLFLRHFGSGGIISTKLHKLNAV